MVENAKVEYFFMKIVLFIENFMINYQKTIVRDIYGLNFEDSFVISIEIN